MNELLLESSAFAASMGLCAPFAEYGFCGLDGFGGYPPGPEGPYPACGGGAPYRHGVAAVCRNPGAAAGLRNPEVGAVSLRNREAVWA